MSKDLVIVGFPRSGTNFLHRLLAHGMDGPDAPVWTGSGEHPHVAKIHWRYQISDLGLQDVPILHLIRDPREVALSAYFCYLKFYGEDRGHTRETLPFLQFLATRFAMGWELWPIGWRQHTRKWIAIQDGLSFFYETLLDVPIAALRYMLGCFDIELPSDNLQFAVEQTQKYNTDRASYVDPSREVPAGTAEWEGFFGKKEKAFMLEYCGELMESLGYIGEERNWDG